MLTYVMGGGGGGGGVLYSPYVGFFKCRGIPSPYGSRSFYGACPLCKIVCGHPFCRHAHCTVHTRSLCTH